MPEGPIILRMVQKTILHVWMECAAWPRSRKWNALKHHGSTAAAPVFFVFGGGDEGFGSCCRPSMMGRLAAFLLAFHLSQEDVPAASMSFTKMALDILSSIVKDFFDPSSKKRLFST